MLYAVIFEYWISVYFVHVMHARCTQSQETMMGTDYKNPKEFKE